MNSVETRLAEFAAMLHGGLIRDMIEELGAANFEHTNKCHDWRNHVDGEIVSLWPELPIAAKLVAYIHAETVADREEWD